MSELFSFRSSRTGCSDILALRVTAFLPVVHEMRVHGKNGWHTVPLDRYDFINERGLPDSVHVAQGEDHSMEQGLASGFGDLWHWSIYYARSMEAAERIRATEAARVLEKYGPDGKKTVRVRRLR